MLTYRRELEPTNYRPAEGGKRMLAYLSQNLGYIATAAVLALIVAAILVRGARARRSGKGRCGCGCAGCPNAGLCHPETARPEGPPAA